MGSWIGGLLLAGLVYWFARTAPAFEDLLTPVYWIIGVILVAATVKWLRSRHSQDRRGIDRRKNSRRGLE